MNAPVFRFAPSPNGPLHLGHAFSALLNHDLARATGGRFLLRIEDIDIARCTPEFETAIYDILDWLGITREREVRRQSEHFDVYRDHLQRLVRDDYVYPAFMSRTEMRAAIIEAEAGGASWPRDPDGVPVYPPTDKKRSKRDRNRRMANGEPFAWRLDMDAAISSIDRTLFWVEASGGLLETETRVEARPREWGDVILARRDVPTSYHLSVVVDDAVQGITHVVRGNDLYQATAVQRVLQVLLGVAPLAYHHHPLVLGPDGRKLSKGAGDAGIAVLRDHGETPEAIRRLVGLASTRHSAK